MINEGFMIGIIIGCVFMLIICLIIMWAITIMEKLDSLEENDVDLNERLEKLEHQRQKK